MERLPDDGPAGVDLQLGCVVQELIRYGTGIRAGGESPRLSAFILLIGAGLGAAGACLWAVRQLLGRRLAPVAPVAVWSCPDCRSLNDAGRDRCYRCGRVPEAGATELRTDAEPLAPQSFGRRFDEPRRPPPH